MTATAFGQLKRADRYSKVGDFKHAAEYYSQSFKRDNSRETLAKLFDSYYQAQDYQNAYTYLKQLVASGPEGEAASYDNAYNIKMYQLLNIKDETKEGLEYLELYYKNKGVVFDKVAALKTIKGLQRSNPKFDATKNSVSSDANDFGAIRVGDSLFFASDRPDEKAIKSIFEKRFERTDRAFLDIYAVHVDEKNEPIGETKVLAEGVNSRLHDGNLCFNNDGTAMYISRSAYASSDSDRIFDEENINRVHLYKSTRIGSVWADAIPLPFIQKQFSYMHPALSNDGKRLYFSSDMDGGYGGFDLYYVDIDADGNYQDPVNLGSKINTSEQEQFPYVSDTDDLFFATDGRLGLGLLDIYVAPHSVKGYTEPINLGAPINSKYDDFSFNYYSENNGLLATNRNMSDDDIYTFTQTNELIQREFDIEIEVRDAVTNELIPNATIKVFDNQKDLFYKDSQEAPSSFTAKLPIDDFTVVGSGENHEEAREALEVRGAQDGPLVILVKQIFTDQELAIMEQKNLPKDLKDKDPSRFELLTDTQAPQVIEKDGVLFLDVEPIYFDFDLSEIRDDSRIVLDALVAKLLKYKRIKMKIHSHTDSRGPEAYNRPLSMRRAKSTFDYLVKNGIAPRRMIYEGYGNSVPVIDCPPGECSESDHQLNRRSEFEITGY